MSQNEFPPAYEPNGSQAPAPQAPYGQRSEPAPYGRQSSPTPYGQQSGEYGQQSGHYGQQSGQYPSLNHYPNQYLNEPQYDDRQYSNQNTYAQQSGQYAQSVNDQQNSNGRQRRNRRDRSRSRSNERNERQGLLGGIRGGRGGIIGGSRDRGTGNGGLISSLSGGIIEPRVNRNGKTKHSVIGELAGALVGSLSDKKVKNQQSNYVSSSNYGNSSTYSQGRQSSYSREEFTDRKNGDGRY